MDKDIFRKTEGKLYRHYRALKSIETLKDEIEELELQRERITKDIRGTNIALDTDLTSIRYGEKVQSSIIDKSEIEKNLIIQIQRLEKEILITTAKINRKKFRMLDLERETIHMRNKIKRLGEKDQQFLFFKYGAKESMDWIAIELFGGARTTAFRKRDKILKEIK